MAKLICLALDFRFYGMITCTSAPKSFGEQCDEILKLMIFFGVLYFTLRGSHLRCCKAVIKAGESTIYRMINQCYYVSFAFHVTKKCHIIIFSAHPWRIEGYLTKPAYLRIFRVWHLFVNTYSVRSDELLTFLSAYDGDEYRTKHCIFWKF